MEDNHCPRRLLQLGLLITLYITHALSACPSECNCDSTEIGCVILDNNEWSLPEDFSEGITKLNIKCDQHTTIRDFSNLKLYVKLHSVNVTGCSLGRLVPDLFTNHAQLTHLVLVNSSISSLHSNNLVGAKALTLLRLDQNVITEIPDKFFIDQTHMIEVNLASNRISVLSVESFKSLVSVNNINLSNNRLKMLPRHAFIECDNSLRILDLSANFLDQIPSSYFSYLDVLEKLYLRNNNVQKLETRAFNIPSLRHLHLNYNRISVISEDAFHEDLEELYLEGNKIQAFSQNILENVLPNLNKLILSFNPLHCNCDMNWFKAYYKNHANTFVPKTWNDPPKCSTPEGVSTAILDAVYNCTKPSYVTIADVGSFKLSCRADGDPLPAISWIRQKDNKLISKTEPPLNKSLPYTIGDMDIDEDTTPGLYLCEAANHQGIISTQLFVYEHIVDGITTVTPVTPGDPPGFLNSLGLTGQIVLSAAVGSVCGLLLLVLIITCCKSSSSSSEEPHQSSDQDQSLRSRNVNASLPAIPKPGQTPADINSNSPNRVNSYTGYPTSGGIANTPSPDSGEYMEPRTSRIYEDLNPETRVSPAQVQTRIKVDPVPVRGPQGSTPDGVYFVNSAILAESNQSLFDWSSRQNY